MEYCSSTDSRNPVEMAMAMMDDKSIFPNGPEHHTLVGAALLAAYKNAGGDLDLPRALAEMRNRSMNVPGGACGLWGTCGAAVSAGMYWSIVSGSTPMTRGPWAETQRLTSRILGRLADLGGPRCCKRDTFLALRAAVAFTAQQTGVQMEWDDSLACEFSAENRECLGGGCPFFRPQA